ncbi:hypothetical protein Mal4_04640 [Maioricimonas rarisocia]|uniref:Uncharacterized protein n=1 Tax=Maioricimonas rarisocia TaxID=2528026 RepID=A0A517Z121_9PLAN|nr:hypothetical protein Mal4_04640 [Maioricimonas rarisocia]
MAGEHQGRQECLPHRAQYGGGLNLDFSAARKWGRHSRLPFLHRKRLVAGIGTIFDGRQ